MTNQSMNQFCPKCGAKNEFNVNFCSQCGTRLSSVTQGPSSGVDNFLRRIKNLLKKISKGYKVSSSGAILAIFCFFMPWFLVSCEGQLIANMSGWELAAGTTVGKGYFVLEVPGEPVLFLVLLAGIAVFLLGYFAYKRGMIKPLDGYGLIGLGVLPLLILFIYLFKFKEQVIEEGLQLECQFGSWGLVLGFWGVILGYIAVIIGGILNLKKSIKSTKQSQNTD
ncbi:zinc-ribbon domain-containing protein [Peptococcaceae bacterium]|nr:zinc-ribbon domain-containing protein [Peptococcaceae bacterium]